MTTEERLAKVEQELSKANRRSCWLLTIMAMAFIALGGLWAFPQGTAVAQGNARTATPNVVRATQFILEDKQGKPRIGLGTIMDEPVLSMIDANGKIRIVIDITKKDGPRMALLDENEETRALLNLLPKGGALFRLNDTKGNTRAMLSGLGDGAGLSLFDVNGKPRVVMDVNKKDGAGMTMFDERGNPIWAASK